MVYAIIFQRCKGKWTLGQRPRHYPSVDDNVSPEPNRPHLLAYRNIWAIIEWLLLMLAVDPPMMEPWRLLQAIAEGRTTTITDFLTRMLDKLLLMYGFWIVLYMNAVFIM